MSPSSKRGNRSRAGGGARGRSRNGKLGGPGSRPVDDDSASLDAAKAEATSYFDRDDEKQGQMEAYRERDTGRTVRRARGAALGGGDPGPSPGLRSGPPASPVDLSKRLKRQSTPTARHLFRAASGLSTDKGAGCTEEQVAVWIARIEKADSKYRWQGGAAGEKGWIRWDDFHRDSPELKPVRQLLRELHLAWKTLGTHLLQKALTTLGPTKAARFLRLRVSSKRLEEMLDRVVILHPGEKPVRVASLTLNQIRTLVRLEAGERDTAEGGREFRWPESLINHTRALLADWPGINEAPKGFKHYRERNLKPAVRAEHREFMRQLLRVFEKAVAQTRKWLDNSETV